MPVPRLAQMLDVRSPMRWIDHSPHPLSGRAGQREIRAARSYDVLCPEAKNMLDFSLLAQTQRILHH